MSTPATTELPTHVTFVLIPRFNMLGLTATIEPMRIANYLSPSELYRWDFRSSKPGLVRGSNGFEVDCGPLDSSTHRRPDLVVVCGSWGAEHFNSPEMSSWLRRVDRNGTPLLAVELGVYLLARAGLLARRRVTTHWCWRPGFAEEFPGTDVCEQLYTIDGNVMSCAGGTAGSDLMLHLIARKHGDQLAAEVANQMLHGARLPAETPQRLVAGGLEEEVHPDVRRAMLLIEKNVEEPISVPAICRQLGTSQRQLQRLFRRETGCTIVQFSQLLRLQHARVVLSSTKMSIREVSVACGFNSLSYFSSAFMKTFGKKPSDYRQAWPENQTAPAWPGTVYDFVQKARSDRRKLDRSHENVALGD